MKRYRNIKLDYGVNEEIMLEYERRKELAAIAAAQQAAAEKAGGINMNDGDNDDITEVAGMAEDYEGTAMMHITELDEE